MLAAAIPVIPAASQRPEPASMSRIALKIDNLLIVGNRIALALACVVQTPLTDADLQKRGLDPAKWRRDYCSQSLSIVEPWARKFRRHGNFQVMPRGAADAWLASTKVGDDGEVDPASLAALGRRLDATHLLLVQEKITPRGKKLNEFRVLSLVDLSSGDVLAVDQTRF